ncbi:phosphatidylinositol mannoside acyltransferase [Arcanobacterium ihumii]|uniref:phosphatidylinositol mannoside acyltransferase n=1 Tax=Arcanobacterium ihumii TaxID=2138162 RepID=UPI000F54A499|nr:phosphatidylinositol mannoside acyltransferase [Arcanobacterium ihumii]
MDVFKLFSLADGFVKHTPDSVSRRVFETVGFAVGLSNNAGVRQLRKNYQRITPLSNKWSQRVRSARAMRSYMRYYQEVFRLKYLNPEQILARVSGENLGVLRKHLEENSCSAALLHAGNWDLAGAWATLDLAPVHTIAEKLEPPELADEFLNVRQSLGMTIYQAVRGANSIGKLTADMGQGICFTPLLCDRDLSATGVNVKLCGHDVRVAPGAAILAIRTGQPMFPVTIISDYFGKDKARVKRAGSPWGIKMVVGSPIFPPHELEENLWIPEDESVRSKRIDEADLAALNQQWLDQIEPLLRDHLEDWHMLQKLFVEDLDRTRLERAKRRHQENNGDLLRAQEEDR